MRQLALLIAGIAFTLTLNAQRIITGVVTDATGPLIGATVQVKGTTLGSVTDFDGNYSIRIPANANTLVFTYVGYATKEITVGDLEIVNATLEEGGTSLDEIIVIGSRSAGRTKLESAVPVDVLDVSKLTAVTAQTNINQMLNFVAPSFTSNTQTISDGTDHIDPASLRALGPDQVLVLINGKRRHTSALVNVNGTFGRGNVGTDMNALPAGAIERIEVLRDGAAAQYGSDAIAGVINIVMKDDVDQLSAQFTTGAYASEGSNFFTGGIDGEAYDLSLNYGLALGDRGGFVNFTGNFEHRNWTSRMKEWEGSIFHAFNGIERLGVDAGLDVSNLSLEQIRDLAPGLSYLSSDEQAYIQNNPLDSLRFSSSSPLSKNVTDEELAARGLDRTDFNMRVGQSEIRGGKFFMNMELPVGNNGLFYAFGGLSNRDGLATGFYRLPNQERTFTQAYPNGFLPQIHTDINDKSMAVGIRGLVQGWEADFSNTFGLNSFRYNVQNSSNATLQKSTPFEFDSGGFSFWQNTTNFDLRRYREDILSGLNFAIGAEYRVENYQIQAGGLNSYASYDVNGEVVTPTTPEELLVTDFFGRGRPGGAQVFPGFQLANELDEFRNSIAAYFDVEADLTEAFLLTFATRFENYSDFGSTTNFKTSARFKITEDWALRGAFSTGFRAPSLHQIYFNSTSTLFVDGIPNEVGTFSNNSRIARILGIPQLKEETSNSFSAGITGRFPDANLSLTIDAFQVDIDDRVVLTGTFDPGDGQTDAQKEELAFLFAQANATSANFFANSIDTRSQGIDVVIAHDAKLGAGNLNTNLSATFSQTEQIGDIQTSEELKDLESVYFDETSRIFLEEAVPRTKVNLSFNLEMGKFNAFLRNVYFGEVKEATNNVARQQVFEGKVVTDLSIGYSLLDNLRLTIGANNLLDIYPDKNFVDPNGDNRSSGRFLYSRRSQQFGMQGRYIFARIAFNL